MFGIATEIWVIVGLMVLAILFLISMLARLYRKAGPHEALIVYGFRGTRVVKGHAAPSSFRWSRTAANFRWS